MIISIFIFFLSKSEYLKYYCSDFYKTYTLRCAFLLSIQCTLIYFIISSGFEINSNKPFCLQNDGEIHLNIWKQQSLEYNNLSSASRIDKSYMRTFYFPDLVN